MFLQLSLSSNSFRWWRQHLFEQLGTIISFIVIYLFWISIANSLRGCFFRDTKGLLVAPWQTLVTWMSLRGNRLWCTQVGQGTKTPVSPMLLCFLPVGFVFCLSSFLPRIASAFRYVAPSTSALCWSLNPRKERWPVRSSEGHCSVPSAFFALWGYCVL